MKEVVRRGQSPFTKSTDSSWEESLGHKVMHDAGWTKMQHLTQVGTECVFANSMFTAALPPELMRVP